jgi:hypothetical protein
MMEELDCGLEELYLGPPVAAMTVPQTIGGGYSWQALEQLPYGFAIYETALVNNVRTVVFMARESRADIEAISGRMNAYWKAISLGMDIKGTRVMPVVVMIYFIPLETIYEVWFNFYGVEGQLVQESFQLLGQQDTIYLMFHDRGPEPIRKIGFNNNLASFFHGHYGMLKAMPAWSDDDFMEAKRRLMEQYSGEGLWGIHD